LQVLLLMLVSSPEALLALEYRQQGFIGLPLGGVPGINSDELLGLIQQLVNSPVSLPLPFAVPLDLETFKLLALGPPGGPQGTLTLDGPDVLDQLKGLALDLHLLDPEAVKKKRVDLGRGWTLSFETIDSGDKHYRIEFNQNAINPAVSRGDFGVFVG